MQEKDHNNPGLTLSRSRFEQAVQQHNESTQKIIQALTEDFYQCERSTFERINFYCNTRSLLLQADCETLLKKKLALIEEKQQQEIIASLTTKKTPVNIRRIATISTQCAALFILTIYLWPATSQKPDEINNRSIASNDTSHQIRISSKQNQLEDQLTVSLMSDLGPVTEEEDEPFFLAHNTDEFDSKQVQLEQPKIAAWLEKIRGDDLRNAIYRNPNIKRKTLALGVIESVLNPYEVSPAGALGAFQIMPGLDGVYGSPMVLKNTIAQMPSCLPAFKGKRQNRATRQYRKLINRKQHIALLHFLKAEKRKRSTFWKTFASQQQDIYVDVHCSQWLASTYMHSLEQSISTLPKRQVEYFSVMAYNMGLENSKRLIKSMKDEKRYIDPVTIINYIADKAFKQKIRNIIARQYPRHSKRRQAQEVRRTLARMQEARIYLARYLAAKKLIQEESQQHYYALASTD